jgi:hypothetical protein
MSASEVKAAIIGECCQVAKGPCAEVRLSRSSPGRDFSLITRRTADEQRPDQRLHIQLGSFTAFRHPFFHAPHFAMGVAGIDAPTSFISLS